MHHPALLPCRASMNSWDASSVEEVLLTPQARAASQSRGASGVAAPPLALPQQGQGAAAASMQHYGKAKGGPASMVSAAAQEAGRREAARPSAVPAARNEDPAEEGGDANYDDDDDDDDMGLDKEALAMLVCGSWSRNCDAQRSTPRVSLSCPIWGGALASGQLCKLVCRRDVRGCKLFCRRDGRGCSGLVPYRGR